MKYDQTTETSHAPGTHSQLLQKELAALITHLRQDSRAATEPRFVALLQTAADVLTGLQTAFEHYDKEHEGPKRPTLTFYSRSHI